MTLTHNLWNPLPPPSASESFETLLQNSELHLERIVSFGQCTPEGQWYDQDYPEWVLLIQGKALLRFEGMPEPFTLNTGDFLKIPARQKHRVEYTESPTVWLALHYREHPGSFLGKAKFVLEE
jgi:cupin 2 domain-containing protein